MENETIVQVTKKTVEYSGRKFFAYKAKTKDGKYIDMKFTKECGEPAVETSKFEVTVNYDDMNISHKSIYPILWVRKYSNVKPIEKNNDEVKAMF